jgi:hypothetical protein
MELKKQLRMTLDFMVSVNEITDESLRDYYRAFISYEELVGDAELWANIGRQVRLQKVLLEDDEALRRFLTYVVVNEVDSSLDSRLGEVFSVSGECIEEEIFEPVFSRLGEDDARYFREVSEGGALWENVEVLSRSFVVSWTSASLEELRAVAIGSPEDVAA